VAEPGPSPREREAKQRHHVKKYSPTVGTSHPDEPLPHLSGVLRNASMRLFISFQSEREVPAFHIREARESICDPKNRSDAFNNDKYFQRSWARNSLHRKKCLDSRFRRQAKH